MESIKVRITFFEELLGTSSNNKELHSEFIASKAPDARSREEEIAAIGVDEAIEKGMTVFPKDEDGRPFIWDYQIKGFFKDACGGLSRAKGTLSEKMKAYKKVIDTLIFPQPRKIFLQLPLRPSFDGSMVECVLRDCERPLRAQTAQGERIALANSETAPAGTMIEFEIAYMDLKDGKGPNIRDLLVEWLEYGKLRGIGQWRNSGKGRFEYEIIE